MTLEFSFVWLKGAWCIADKSLDWYSVSVLTGVHFVTQAMSGKCNSEILTDVEETQNITH